MDFTQSIYKSLLKKLRAKYNNFIPFQNYLQSNNLSVAAGQPVPWNETKDTPSGTINQSVILLRHDVDRLPQNALKLAQIENELGIKGTYYFRIVPESFDLNIMHKIAELGHEIGYHYEDVDLVSKGKQTHTSISKQSGDPDSSGQTYNHTALVDAAYESFCQNLETFRQHFEIKTVCMHGSPRAKYDNKLIWDKYDYKDLGIIGEPYYDIDFDEFAYFTDTGRRWNGHRFSVRDKVDSNHNFNFKTTQQIINNIDSLPLKVMFTIHPERWNDSLIFWSKELIGQNIKNLVKSIIVKKQQKLG